MSPGDLKISGHTGAIGNHYTDGVATRAIVLFARGKVDDTDLTQVTISANRDTLLCHETRHRKVEIATVTKAGPSEQ